VLLLAGTVLGSTPLEPWVRTGLGKLPVSVADRRPERSEVKAGQTDLFVDAIVKASQNAPRPAKQWAALLLTIGSSESNFDSAIVLGDCRPWQCDRGRARGAFQNQRVSFNAELWDRAHGDIEVQVKMADLALRRSLVTCIRLGVPYPAGVFRAYAGRSCSWPLHDEARRVATYLRLVAR
jgi:hypothetical protein